MLAGLAISAPVGPVNILCIQRAISSGWTAGVISGLGAATADTIYGAIAGFSIHFLISLLLREEFWLRFFGGILLIVIGVIYFVKKPKPLSLNRGATKTGYISAFLLTLTNPTVVLSYLAVLAALHLEGRRPWWQTLYLVAGIFLGAMLWWIFLATVSHHFRARFHDRAMVWMNRIAGLAIGGFGVLTLILSRGRPK
jgi:threonine/homoserine/homoserine lactone efflux protein